MTERPILFSAPMVRAILAGTKTQTRRVVKPQPFCTVDAWPFQEVFDKARPDRHGIRPMVCHYGQPGDRLWVRETHAPQADCWAAWHHEMEGYNAGPKPIIHYKADGGDPFIEKWRPSIHMPRFASRITLEITGVRVERLQDISESDAKAVGVQCGVGCPDHRIAFGRLWENINGAGSWALNPYVWVLEVKRI